MGLGAADITEVKHERLSRVRETMSRVREATGTPRDATARQGAPNRGTRASSAQVASEGG